MGEFFLLRQPHVGDAQGVPDEREAHPPGRRDDDHHEAPVGDQHDDLGHQAAGDVADLGDFLGGIAGRVVAHLKRDPLCRQVLRETLQARTPPFH